MTAFPFGDLFGRANTIPTRRLVEKSRRMIPRPERN